MYLLCSFHNLVKEAVLYHFTEEETESQWQGVICPRTEQQNKGVKAEALHSVPGAGLDFGTEGPSPQVGLPVETQAP